MKNVKHSSGSDRWFTPQHIIDMAREVLGEITLDPASEEIANKRVNAQHYLTKDDNGLTAEWIAGSVFLNPPGSKLSGKSISSLFWRRLMEHRDSGKLTHAIFVGFSIEQLAISQSYHSKWMLDFPVCIPPGRLHFMNPESESNRPSHNNVIVYVPGSIDNTDLFVEIFSQIGKCKR